MNLLLLFLLGLGFLESEGGGELLPSSSRSLALSVSNMGLSDSISGFLDNPSLLGSTSGFSLYGDGRVGYHSETHLRQVYDRFDNTIGEEAIYSLASGYIHMGALAVSYSRNGLGVGLSYVPRIDLTYDYERTERTDFYTVVSKKKRTVRGGVSEVGLSFGYNLGWAALGLSGTYLMGKRADSTTLFYQDSTIISGFEATFTGYGGRIGATFSPLRTLTFGVFYSPKVTMKGDMENNFPELFSLGLSFRPPSKWPAFLYLRFVYVDWHKEGLLAQRVYAVGFAHKVYGGTEFRLGARFENDYVMEDYWYPVYSLGLGQSLSNFRFDMGIQLKPKDYRLNDESGESVDESIVHVRIGGGYNF